MILLIIFLNVPLLAQVNTEVMRPEFDTLGIQSNTQFNFALSSGNVNFNTVGLSSRLDINKKSFKGFVIGSYNYSEANDELVAQNGFLHFRLSYFRMKYTSTESFVQSEFNSFRLLRGRYLIGTNQRFVINFNKNNSVAIGSGLMYEKENLNEDPFYTTDKWRWNNYINLQLKISNVLNLVTSSYFQMDVIDPTDFRLLNESNLEFRINKYLKFIFSLVYRYDEEPPTDVLHYDLLISNGIRVSF